jgi:hypothetical protein
VRLAGRGWRQSVARPEPWRADAPCAMESESGILICGSAGPLFFGAGRRCAGPWINHRARSACSGLRSRRGL